MIDNVPLTQDARELQEIDAELDAIESEITSLLQRQSDLLDRKQLIQQLRERQALVGNHDRPNQSHAKEQQQGDIDWQAPSEWTSQVHQLLHEQFGLESFRPLQEQVINATLSNRDVFVIMRSGGGKSLCYQLPALLQKGFTVVISPLISLIHDQVMLFNDIVGDPNAAVALTSDQSRQEASQIYQQLLDDTSSLRILLVTPEKIIKSKLLLSRLEKVFQSQRLQRFVIDEAHCCSQWGHDFRQDYAKLGLLRRQFPTVPLLALTATATPRVVADVQSILEIQTTKSVFFRTSFVRHNLRFDVMDKPPKDNDALEKLVQIVQRFDPNDTGIIYCLTRKETEQVAQHLWQKGIRVACYHAYMDNKQQTHTSWCRDEIQIVVATIAFGLGINKPDVRFVIHFTLSKSMEGYYQEAGRAGRDGAPARCILMYRPSDVVRVCNIAHSEAGGLRNVRLMIEYCEAKRQCRNAIMAKFFEESFDASVQCQNHCDNCNRDPTHLQQVDFYQHANAIVKLLIDIHQKEKRFTLKQLVDELKTRRFGQREPDLTPSFQELTQNQVESLVLHMMLRNLIAPEISYTAYATNCYFVVANAGVARRQLAAQQPGGFSLQLLLASSPQKQTTANNKVSLFKAKANVNERFSKAPRKRKVVEIIDD